MCALNCGCFTMSISNIYVTSWCKRCLYNTLRMDGHAFGRSWSYYECYNYQQNNAMVSG